MQGTYDGSDLYEGLGGLIRLDDARLLLSLECFVCLDRLLDLSAADEAPYPLGVCLLRCWVFHDLFL